MRRRPALHGGSQLSRWDGRSSPWEVGLSVSPVSSLEGFLSGRRSPRVMPCSRCYCSLLLSYYFAPPARCSLPCCWAVGGGDMWQAAHSPPRLLSRRVKLIVFVPGLACSSLDPWSAHLSQCYPLLLLYVSPERAVRFPAPFLFPAAAAACYVE